MERLSIQHVWKKIDGNDVLKDINLELDQKDIHVLVGENGSGKTMLIRMLAGLVYPTKGRILFGGLEREKADLTVGVMIEHASLYPDFSAMENLELLAGIRKRITKEEIRNAIERVGLDLKDKKPFRKYSLGMKQRLLLAQAVMEKPDILLLDEPTNAIDKEGKELFYQIIEEEHQRGAWIIIASHSEQDIDVLGNHIIHIDQGRIVEYK